VNRQESAKAAPGLIKLGACLLYELLTVIAIVFVSTSLFVWIAGDATHGANRLLLQLFLWLMVGAYFIWCWLKSGQTLAMQAWKLKLLGKDGQGLSVKSAMLRYLLATLSLSVLGAGFLWAVLDKQNLFLHDRILKNRIVLNPYI
jgi:uncharacterized RDD family membrane protein YckC